MRKTYINGLGCVSAQKTVDSFFLEEAEKEELHTVLALKTPVYKDYIPPTAIRRMSKGVKNGIVAATLAMKEANVENLDAIITGTGLGCIDDSDKFLRAIIDNKEEFLTPTSFIQSTHNTVGSQIALGLQCNAYNFTYVNGSVSFESALLDAKMKIDSNEAASVLIGGVDEMNLYTASLFKLAGIIKQDNQSPYTILNSDTKGAIYSEGATFFVLEDKKNKDSYAEVLDVDIYNRIDLEEIESKMNAFLTSNAFKISDIDLVVFGYNGDLETDVFYKKLAVNCFSNIQQVYYKHLSGEYNTASAFGLWVAAKICKNQEIPEILKINNQKKKEIRTVLLYNQFKGIDHSFTLISKC